MLPANEPIARVSVADYLLAERAAGERHTFLDGTVIAMAGESNAHGDISFNLVVLVGSQLRGTLCRGKTKDTKVRSGPAGPRNPRDTAGLFSYPDVVVVCGEPEFLDNHTDVLLNPTAIFEVLSPSTELFDRGEKFRQFQRWNPSLQDYLLVAQDRPQVEQYTRQPDGRWLYSRHDDPAGAFAVESIGCTLRLADVYDRVVLPDPDGPPADEPG